MTKKTTQKQDARVPSPASNGSANRVGNEPSPEEEMCRKVARVIGEGSAAAAALRDLDQRRADGLIAWLSYDGRTWLVGSGRGSQNDPKLSDRGGMA